MTDYNPADQNAKTQQALDGLDHVKRETLTRLVNGSAFAEPLVASFPMKGLAIKEVAGSGTACGNT